MAIEQLAREVYLTVAMHIKLMQRLLYVLEWNSYATTVQYATPRIHIGVRALSEVKCNRLHRVGIGADWRCPVRIHLRYGEYRVRLRRTPETNANNDQAVRNAYHRCSLRDSQSIAKN
jgi:hypothetical protein